MRRISKNRMIARLRKLEDGATTSEVAKTLGLSERLLRDWTADPEFVQAQVAKMSGKRLVWNKSKLILWVQAVMNLAETKGYRAIKRNPPIEMNPSQAASKLGIPEGYRVRR